MKKYTIKKGVEWTPSSAHAKEQLLDEIEISLNRNTANHDLIEDSLLLPE